MGTFVRCSLALVAVFGFAGGASGAPVDPETLNFQAIVNSGPLAGEIGTGTVTYDKDELSGGFGIFDGSELQLTFTFLGGTFSEVDDKDYDHSPTLIVINTTDVWSMSYVLEDKNGLDLDYPSGIRAIERLAIDGKAVNLPGGPPPDIYDFLVTLDVTFVPLPAGLPLLASALAGFGFFYWRRKRPV